jgi:CRISPR system Cascade subunit CasE
MFLSKILINPSSKEANVDLKNPYQMHRTIMKAFPNGIDREKAAALYRIEHPTKNSMTNVDCVLVQSVIKPDWKFLVDRKKYLAEGYQKNPAILEFNPKIQSNQIFQFRLVVNPTRRNRNNKKLEPILEQENLLNWLMNKGAMHGFSIDPANLLIRRLQVDMFEANQHNRRKVFTIHKVSFEGILEVEDSQKILRVLENGIGRGKSFGCGLLSLAIV